MERKKKLSLLIIVVVSAVIISRVIGLDELISIENIKMVLTEYPYGSIIIYCILFSISNLLYIPGVVFLAAPSSLFSVLDTFLLVYTAAMISSCISYFLISFFGKNSLSSLGNKYLKAALENLDIKPIRSVIVLRTLMQTNPVLNYSLSLSNIHFREYFVGTAVGLILPIFVYCYFFQSIFKYIL